ncbi:SusD/RagB family nutrient-binding outer membrane lipoprotein [Neotamlana laminarinivorans]|uniref:SusD/RagB family nutrient-binding outer membrane lipoprotein n=1 Tax=Neotamlana laminarinivorans TaxID=2883124 RepID=A0A9X1L319_9FLAO|nr:SusD/RagB family nutrient-binding outer membrane lipoprotein [Tamlana laminarinivorans]MCB4798209.1 SusD/RagB family nutrient-binding outer membrane lipoprotein [Tamlana laminarinivorans]
MKNTIKNILLLVLITTGIYSCDDYLDVNKPSSAQTEDALDMKDIIGPVMFNTVYAFYYSELTYGNYTQYFGSYGYGSVGLTSNSATWSNIYTEALPNIEVLKSKAEEQEAVYYMAVIKILEAVNLSLAVENWGDVPYSETGDPFIYPYPSLDDGETVYYQALDLLNEAIAALQGTDNSQITMGTEDLFYDGDFDKWLRAAYTFKARMQLKLINTGGATAADVIASIDNGLASNDDNVVLEFPEGELNPYYSTNVLARATSNFYRAPNDQLISIMNGTTYPFESGVVEIDPRLPEIFENEGEDGDPWRGFMNGGTGESSDGEPANTYYKDGGYHTSATSSLILLTYAEAMFIKAEAEFLANGGTTTSVGSSIDAYNAYLAGISANMDEIGVDGTNYMADTAVAVGVDGLMLNHIMKEKYIANIHNVETYNDMRRYNFSADVFKDLDLRLEEDADASEYGGQWFRRSIYPLSETDSNENITYDESSSIVDIWLFE